MLNDIKRQLSTSDVTSSRSYYDHGSKTSAGRKSDSQLLQAKAAKLSYKASKAKGSRKSDPIIHPDTVYDGDDDEHENNAYEYKTLADTSSTPKSRSEEEKNVEVIRCSLSIPKTFLTSVSG